MVLGLGLRINFRGKLRMAERYSSEYTLFGFLNWSDFG